MIFRILAAPGSKWVPKCNSSPETWSGWVFVVPHRPPTLPRSRQILSDRRLAIGSVRLLGLVELCEYLGLAIIAGSWLDKVAELANCHRLLIRKENGRVILMEGAKRLERVRECDRLLIIPA